jgi:hypothetical protein
MFARVWAGEDEGPSLVFEDEGPSLSSLVFPDLGAGVEYTRRGT